MYSNKTPPEQPVNPPDKATPSQDQEIATVVQLVKTAPPHCETVLELAEALDKRGGKLTIERKAVPPVRCETPARNHQIASLDALVAYLRAYGTADTVVFVRPADGAFCAVLSERAAQGVEHIGGSLDLHPVCEAWVKAFKGSTVLLEDFARHVAKYRRYIVDGADLTALFSQIRTSKKITRDTGIGRKSVNGLRVECEIQGALKGESLELPDSLTVRCPVYKGQLPSEITVDLLVNENGDNLVVESTSPDWLDVRDAAFADEVSGFRDNLADALRAAGRPQILVIEGWPAWLPWKYQE